MDNQKGGSNEKRLAHKFAIINLTYTTQACHNFQCVCYVPIHKASDTQHFLSNHIH